jgi:hypothetical protein
MDERSASSGEVACDVQTGLVLLSNVYTIMKK